MSGNRIAKNTFFLSIRMLFTMFISLYTSRIILQILGVSDFGIYNVVGGIVVILGFLSGALSTASSRFITVALGSGNLNEMRQTFSSIFFVNMFLSCLILIFGETIGIWFLNYKLQIPPERMQTAYWVFQLSLLTVIINILSVPYNAVIIAHEKMKAFAYMSLFDVFAKLLLVFVLKYIDNFDKLLLYAIILCIVQLLDRLIYGYYCSKNFNETRISLILSKKKIMQVFYFIGWSSYGSLVSVGFTQGLNLLLNIFFGTIVNAARGISVIVQNSILQFTLNFQTAINPQITKSFVVEDFQTTRRLVIMSSKLSFFMICIIALPIIIEAKFVLSMWLKVVPPYTVHFVQLMLIISIWSSLANPLRIVNQAEGNIRKFQIYECSFLLLIVPLSYISLRIIKIPEVVFLIHLFIEILAQFIRIKIVLPKINFKTMNYIKNVYLRIIPVFFIPIFIGILCRNFIYESTNTSVLIMFLIVLSVFTTIVLLGIDVFERMLFKNKIVTILNSLKK
jgi:Na+-driven multidrug efflux pump